MSPAPFFRHIRWEWNARATGMADRRRSAGYRARVYAGAGMADLIIPKANYCASLWVILGYVSFRITGGDDYGGVINVCPRGVSEKVQPFSRVVGRTISGADTHDNLGVEGE